MKAIACLLFLAALSDEGALRRRIAENFWIPAPLPALNVETHGSFEPEPGIVADRVTYATEFGMLIPAVVYHSRDTGVKRPGLIVVNGHGGDKYAWYSFYSGIVYARAGAVVLTYDPAGEGERNHLRKSGTRQHDIIQQPENAMARRMAGLMMTDLEQAVSYLAQRPDVDPNRIAAAGYSMGSFVVALSCAVETRLHGCVLTGGGDLDGPGGYWDTNNKKMCQSIPYQSLSFLGDRPAVLYALQASHAATLVFNGWNDEVVDIPDHRESFFRDLHQRTIQARGSTKNVFRYEFDPTGSHRPYFITKPVALWLHRQLHLPNWSEAAIRSMNETHISEWAQTNGVFMDKAYANEPREGGTIALGRDVPPVRRDLLNVLSEEEWEIRKSSLVLEIWWEQARTSRTSLPF